MVFSISSAHGCNYLCILYSDNVLSGGNKIGKKDYEEALTLLKDMQRRYKMTHQKSMEQAAQLEIKKI